jgi:hypothetical protein
MEHLLWLYAQPYDPQQPVICFDERPCFLIGDRVDPQPLQPGRVSKEHYAYTKHGSCALFAAIEPLTGNRLAEVYPRRTQCEYTRFCQALVARWPQADKIRLVQDNLNTHHASAFYASLPADQAFALAQKFEFVYTPKSASWLNMIEIEFSAIVRQCLKRRIPTLDQLRREVLAIVRERNKAQVKIDWQFSIPHARHTMNRHYRQLHPDNDKFRQT